MGYALTGPGLHQAANFTFRPKIAVQLGQIRGKYSMSLSERAAKAAKIAAEPQLYKVCEGCDSIVTKRVATCPSCHGYRFIEDSDVVIEQAKILGSREQRSVVSEDLL
jgi:hypothetical protein